MRVARWYIFVFLFIQPAFSASSCQAKLLKLFRRVSPDSGIQHYVAANAKTVSRLDVHEPTLQPLFSPEWHAKGIEGGEIKFSLVSYDQFESIANSLSDKGVWMVYNPSPLHERVQSGHFSIRVGDTYYARDIDTAHPQGVLTGKTLDPLWINKDPYVMAQFFEMDSATIATLKKYFDDRVTLHKKDASYQTKYVKLPFTHDKDEICGENCVSFTFSFFQPRWLQLRPELASAGDEFGNIRVAELPVRQIYNNTSSQAYRGALILSRNLDRLKDLISSGKLNEDPLGMQLFFDNPIQKLR